MALAVIILLKTGSCQSKMKKKIREEDANL